MSYKVEFDDGARDYRMVVIRLTGELQYRCGYVSVPLGHPWHGKDYQHKVAVPDVASIQANATDPIGTVLAVGALQSGSSELPIAYLAQVHGGITYAGCNHYLVEGPSWWFGFDANHCDDKGDGGQPLNYMIEQCKKLREFLRVAATPAKPTKETLLAELEALTAELKEAEASWMKRQAELNAKFGKIRDDYAELSARFP